jgi:uncharacterized protein YdhG (YjbR/CyaY superfamily)
VERRGRDACVLIEVHNAGGCAGGARRLDCGTERSKMKRSQSQPGGIDGYIAGSPEAARGTLEKVRATIRKAAPEATETIKYGIPTFVLGEDLVHFAAFKKHIGFYPTPSAIAAFRDQLSAYKSAKGSVQFPLTSPTPLKLIEQMVRFRVEEVRSRDRG